MSPANAVLSLRCNHYIMYVVLHIYNICIYLHMHVHVHVHVCMYMYICIRYEHVE